MAHIMERHNMHVMIMMMCFIYGGISLTFFLIQVSPLIGSSRALPAPFEGEFRALINNSEDGLVYININTSEDFMIGVHRDRFERFQSNISMSFYSIVFVSLLGSVTSITAGISLWFLLKKKERKKLTDDIVSTMTTEDEKRVMRVLEDHGNELTQSEIVKRTKLSKVKVHRVVKRLESLGIVDKYSYGMTNKIRLRDLHEKK